MVLDACVRGGKGKLESNTKKSFYFELYNPQYGMLHHNINVFEKVLIPL
jgi:hypothetical protein